VKAPKGALTQDMLAKIEKLWGAAGTPAGDELDVLATLVETYEERRWPFPSRRRFDPIDVLRYAIEELGHTQAELAKIIGSRARASEILARRRPLTLQMIQKDQRRLENLGRSSGAAVPHHGIGGVTIVLAIFTLRDIVLVCGRRSRGN